MLFFPWPPGSGPQPGRSCPLNLRSSAALTEVLQGADEPYNSFISCLMETAEHLFGVQEPENPFVKQLAFENANPTCQDILQHHRSKSLAEYVHLCVWALVLPFRGQA